jgi:uncharacterized protein (DUF362 family)
MAILVRKTKIAILGLLALILSLVVGVWYLFFAGKAKPLEKSKYISRNQEKSNQSSTNINNAIWGQENSLAKTQPQEEKVEKPYLVITRNNSAVLGINEAIQKIGIDFIKKGDIVLIKPNLNTGLVYPATTNPEVVGEVVRLVKEAGAERIIVGDRSSVDRNNLEFKNTLKNFKTSGIKKAAEENGAEIMAFEETEWVRVKPEGATHWPQGFRIPKILLEVDHIISLPVIKTHVTTDYTMSLKNLVGIIHPADRYLMHDSSSINEMIAEISLVIKPKLIVLDGTKSFITKGPNWGAVKEPKTYIATIDPVAADALGIEILNQFKAQLREKDPYKQKQIKRAFELGLNKKNKDEIIKLVAERVNEWNSLKL